MCTCLYHKGTTTGSVQATDRLMKELREIYRSNSFKQGNMGRLSFDVTSHYCSLYQFVGHKPSVCSP